MDEEQVEQSAQIYSLKVLPNDFKLLKDPYEDEEECKRLHDLGVFFYRDEDNGHSPLTVEVDLPVDAFYYHFVYFAKTGEVSKIVKKSKARVLWYTDKFVKRIILDEPTECRPL